MLSDTSPPYLWGRTLTLLKVHCTVTFTEGEWSHREHRYCQKHGVPYPRTPQKLSHTPEWAERPSPPQAPLDAAHRSFGLLNSSLDGGTTEG